MQSSVGSVGDALMNRLGCELGAEATGWAGRGMMLGASLRCSMAGGAEGSGCGFGADKVGDETPGDKVDDKAGDEVGGEGGDEVAGGCGWFWL